jgi:hypothetical protein
VKVRVGNVEHDLRVEAAFSVPRLGFQDNFFCAFQSLLPNGIQPTKFTGPFWGQCMDRVLLEMVDRTEWILCTDFDSVYEADTVQRLLTAAMVSGYDAVAPMQCKRDEGIPMFTPEGHFEIGRVEIAPSWFEATIQPVDSAHFGCTLLRSSALKRTKTPWFVGTPAEDGHWHDVPEGQRQRVEEDIAFWKTWKASGKRWAFARKSPSGTLNSCLLGPAATSRRFISIPPSIGGLAAGDRLRHGDR